MSDKITASAKIVLENINEEIKVREDELKQLTTTRTALLELYGLAPEVSSPDRSPAKSRPAKAAPAKAKSNGSGSGRQPSADYVRLMAAARTAPEPFTTASLKVTTGIADKFISNKLWKWKEAGFIKKTGPGAYERTQSFPAAPAE